MASIHRNTSDQQIKHSQLMPSRLIEWKRDERGPQAAHELEVNDPQSDAYLFLAGTLRLRGSSQSLLLWSRSQPQEGRL